MQDSYRRSVETEQNKRGINIRAHFCDKTHLLKLFCKQDLTTVLSRLTLTKIISIIAQFAMSNSIFFSFTQDNLF